MATDKEKQNQEELNKAKVQGNKIQAEGNKLQEEHTGAIDNARKLAALLTSENRALNEELRFQLGVKQRQSDFDKALLKVARQITAASEQNAVALGRSGDISKAVLKDQITLQDALREADISRVGLANDQVGLATRINKLNDQALKLQDKIEKTTADAIGLKGDERKEAEKDIQRLKDEQGTKEELLQNSLARLKPEGQRLALALQMVDQAKKNVAVKQEEGSIQDQVNKSMGVTGALMKSAKGLMGQLGMGSLANLINLEESTKELKKQVDAIERQEEVNGKIVHQGKQMTKSAAIRKAKADAYVTSLKGAVKTAFSLESILAFVTKSLLGASAGTAKFQKSLNVSYGTAYMMQREFQAMEFSMMSNFITSEKLGKSFMALSDYMGQNASAMMADGGTALKSYTYLTDKLHLSADAAGQLVTATKLSGQNTEDAFDAMGDQLTAFNQTNKSAFRLTDIMKDIGKMSKAVVLQLDKSPEKLLAAAAAARKLGVNMEQLEAIGENLLNFESSIEKELEAQLLTGNALNLNRARELAMMGDMEGLATEIGNQEAIKNAFATKNVIAQKAAAEALGMSREQLAQMTYQQELNNMNAEAFVAKYGEVAYKSAKAQSAQEKFTDAITKMQSILANVVGAFSPIIDALAYIVSIPFVPHILAGVVAIKALGGGIGNSIKGMGSLVGKFKELGKGGLLSGIKEKIGGIFSKDGANKITKDAQGKFRDAKGRFAKNPMSKTMDKGAEATGKMQQKTKGAKDKGPKGFLKSLGDGLAHIGKIAKDVIKGAGALAISGLLLGGSFALALKMVENVDPKVMLAFAGSIGIFAGSLYLVSKVANDAIKGAIAMGIIGVALIPAAKAFQMMAGVDFAQVALLSGSLIVLGGAAALLGKIEKDVIKGALALGILGVGLIPAAFAFSLLEGVDYKSIIAFSIALPLLALAAAGLGFLIGPIMLGAAAIAILGAAMIPAAIAFNIMAKADLATIAEGLGGIASVGPKLALAGIGMIALAAGAAVLGLASPMLIFAGAALAVLGMAAQIASNANIEGIASQLTQLAGIGPGLVAAGIGLFAVAGGMTAFALAMAGASALGALTSIFGGGVMGDLQALAAMAEPLASVGVSLTAIAAGLSGIALALSTLETEKINELKGLVMSAASESPLAAATGAITELISGISGGGDSSNQELLAEIKLLRAAVEAGGDVFIDGNKAGNAMLLSSYKSS